MAKEDTSFQEALADAVLDLPREFFIGEKRYNLYSPTLGVTILVEKRLNSLGIDEESMKKNRSFEALRICSTKKDEVCSILALHTIRDFKEIADSDFRKKRERELKDLETDELAKLLLLILSDFNAETLISLSGLQNEQIRQSQIAKYKNKKGNTITFGGKTIYGMLLETACAKYGWTKEYVVWGIDLISLKMMLADSINSVYISDEEMKALHINSSSNQKVEMTNEAIEKIKKQYDWS